MKKTFKTLLAIMAGALCLAGCEKEVFIEKSCAELVTLTAYQEGDDTKAAIDATDSRKINWTANDKINYFGGATGQSMTLTDGAGTTSGTFQGSVTTGESDCVLYPYQSTATNNAVVITAEVPMTQYAVANSFDPAAALMVGVVNGSKVEFKNVMSYVKVTIPSDMTNCKQVSLKAKDAWTTVAGKVKINATEATWTETDAKEGQAFVRLVPKAPATNLVAGTSYYIAILPQTMATGFELIFNDNDVIKVKQSSTSNVVFARSTTKKIGTISDFTYTVTTAKMALTADLSSTLHLADHNIGAVNTSDYGDYFAWGALRPAYITHTQGDNLSDENNYNAGGFKPANSPYYDSSSSSYSKYNTTDAKLKLDSNDDIAAMLWGGNWRIPTGTELNNNKSGQAFYSYIPKAGYYSGLTINNSESYGTCWSKDLFDNTSSIFLSAHANTQSTSINRAYGLSVRPVLSTLEGSDISTKGTANCYVVPSAGTYKFKAVKGNSSEPIGEVASLEVIWESVGGTDTPSKGALVGNLKYDSGYISFTATNVKGNAQISAKNKKTTVLWSWHIWLTDNPSDIEYRDNDSNVVGSLMDRNLGAADTTPGSSSAIGLLYQWGRKDPFINRNTIDGQRLYSSVGTIYASQKPSSSTIEYSILCPNTPFIVYYNGDWLKTSDSSLWSEEKTIYDPCPAGYRVASSDFWANSALTASAWNSEKKGMTINGSWYPASGEMNESGTVQNAGTYGRYWTIGACVSGNYKQAYTLSFGESVYGTKVAFNRAYSFAVRCQKIQ